MIASMDRSTMKPSLNRFALSDDCVPGGVVAAWSSAQLLLQGD